MSETFDATYSSNAVQGAPSVVVGDGGQTNRDRPDLESSRPLDTQPSLGQRYGHLLRVTFFAAFVLLVESVLFHVVNYIHGYYTAVSALSQVILGIGLGAFLAGYTKRSTDELFALCCTGASAMLFVMVVVIGVYPAAWLLSLLLPLCFVFPMMYIARSFKESDSRGVYFFDMLGAGLGVIATLALFLCLLSEEILLAACVVTPLVGLTHMALMKSERDLRFQRMTLANIALAGLVLTVVQLSSDTFNLFRILSRQPNLAAGEKSFDKYDGATLDKSYDSLVGRIDVIKWNDKLYQVAYDGCGNDHFGPSRLKPFSHYRDLQNPTKDIRVLYGAVKEPRVYVIGSSAQGIIKKLKRITPSENIVPVEINPGIMSIMTRDFWDQSGRAYEGLRPVAGNGLAVLKSCDEEFDIITLINTHSTRSISHRGAPDYLHTAESYHAYFDKLSDRGYLLTEERLMNRSGELGFYRIINTMWNVLKERGAEDPSSHFVIWEWMGKTEPEFARNSERYYVSMIVSREPLRGQFREDVLRGARRVTDKPARAVRLSYFKGESATDEYQQLFSMVERGDFSALNGERFDSTLITNDRPFGPVSTLHTPRLNVTLISTGWVSLGMLLFFAWHIRLRRREASGVVRKAKPAGEHRLFVFNVLIGMGYFFVEIVLMLAYQNLFVAPAMTVILVLALLLVSSAVGGALSSRWKAWQTTAALVPLSYLAIVAPTLLVDAGAPLLLTQSIGVALIALVGLLMGMYFPQGLALAKKLGLSTHVPDYVAVNAIAGSLAIVLALFLGVKFGYHFTMGAALASFVAATIVLALDAKWNRTPAEEPIPAESPGLAIGS